MRAVRLAALRLADLPRADRLWLLRRLPRRQRPAVRSALQQLRASRLPAPAALLCELFAATLARPVIAADIDSSADQRVQRIDDAAVEAVLDLMQGWPVGMRATLCGLHAWRWRESLLQMMNADDRQALMIALQGDRVPAPGAKQALLALVADALDEGNLRITTGQEAAPWHG